MRAGTQPVLFSPLPGSTNNVLKNLYGYIHLEFICVVKLVPVGVLTLVLALGGLESEQSWSHGRGFFIVLRSESKANQLCGTSYD